MDLKEEDFQRVIIGLSTLKILTIG